MIYSKKPFVPRGPLHPSVHRQAHCPANSLHLCVVKTCLITLLFHSSSKYTWNSPFSCKCYSNLNQITPHANTLSHQTGNIISMWYSTMSTYLLTFIDPVCCVERQSNMAWVDNELTIIRFPPSVVCAFLSASPFIYVYVVCLSLCYSNFLFELVNQFPCVCVFIYILFFLVRRQQVCFSASFHACLFVSLCTSQKFFFIINFAVFTSVGHLLDFSYLNYATETIDFESAVYMGADLIRSGIYTC